MRSALLIGVLMLCGTASYAQQQPIDGVDARSNSADFAKQLGSTDAHVRQRSAEALAQLAATEQRKLVEGYQLQEKNKEVRLALDWALYRMGRSDALYRVVADLDSGRQEQAIGYLAQLESPDVLYPFLKKQNNAPPNLRSSTVFRKDWHPSWTYKRFMILWAIRFRKSSTRIQLISTPITPRIRQSMLIIMWIEGSIFLQAPCPLGKDFIQR